MPTIKKGIARVYGYEEKANKDQLNGYPSLDAGGKIPVAEIPNLSATYLPLIGGTMSGQIDYSYLYFNMGFSTGIEDTEFVAGQPRELSFYDQLNPATGSRQKTLTRLAMPGLLPETMFPEDVAKWLNITLVTGSTIQSACYLGNGIVIACSNNGHIWRSIDYGTVWTDLGAIAAEAIVASCYLGNGISIIGTANGHVWRSTDYGVNWTDLGAIGGANYIYSPIYIGRNGMVILYTTQSKIYRSTDYGVNYADITPALGGQIIGHASSYLGNGIVLVGSSLGHIWRSTNYGSTWTDLGLITNASIIEYMSYLGNGIVIICSQAGYLYRSIDYGVTWTFTTNLHTNPGTLACYLGNGISIIAAQDRHLYRSTNFGLNWTDLGTWFGVGSYSWVHLYLGNGIGFIFSGMYGYRFDLPYKLEETNVLLERPVTIVNSNITVSYSHSTILVDSPGVNRTITLQDAQLPGMTGHEFTIVNIATGCIVTIATVNNRTINGYLNPTLDIQWQSMTVVSNGVGWVIT